MSNIFLFFLPLIIGIVSFVGFKFLNNKITSNYFFWAIPAIIILGYNFGTHSYEYWVYFFNNLDIITGEKLNYDNSYSVAQVFLLDLCPLMTFLIPLSLIFDKSRRVSYVIGPFGILGGVVTMLGILTNLQPEHGSIPTISFEYMSSYFYFSHSYIIIIGFMLTSKSNLKEWKHLGFYYLFFGIFVSYILIIKELTGVQYFTMGISPNDWLPAENSLTNQTNNGQFYGISVALNLGYPYIMIAVYTIGLIFINFIGVLLILLKNFDIKKFKFIKKDSI